MMVVMDTHSRRLTRNTGLTTEGTMVPDAPPPPPLIKGISQA
jgi:hypothetical protein